jgi:hypothetical protein
MAHFVPIVDCIMMINIINVLLGEKKPCKNYQLVSIFKFGTGMSKNLYSNLLLPKVCAGKMVNTKSSFPRIEGNYQLLLFQK